MGKQSAFMPGKPLNSEPKQREAMTGSQEKVKGLLASDHAKLSSAKDTLEPGMQGSNAKSQGSGGSKSMPMSAVSQLTTV